ncbi:MAG: 16S rRNA (adenine(1518)-N(6)/adenine(1519)-N(6))-dimethyltransferase RsmA [Acetivibrionales bacterium]
MEADIKHTLKKFSLKPVKSLGQNFVTDPWVLEKMTEAAGLDNEDIVLEIGPGTGSLTAGLAEKAGGVVAVEIDRRLIPVLHEKMKEYPNVHIINADILKLDIGNILTPYLGEGRRLKVVANLPYYITTPVIMKLLEERIGAKTMVFMVQKEVAGRMKAKPGGKDYGALSIAIQYYSEPSVIFDVPPHCFIPRPDVYSSVIKLEMLDRPRVEVRDEALFFRLVKAAFAQRRKTLANALINAGYFGLDREQTSIMLSELGIGEKQRGETLTIGQFAQLANYLSNTLNTKKL